MIVIHIGLHSRLLALSGTGSFVLALGRIELVAEGEADGTMHLIIQLHGAKTTIHKDMALPGIKEVSHLELQTHPVVQETFVKVEVHIPTVLQIFRIYRLAFRLIVCIGIYPKTIGELHRVSP